MRRGGRARGDGPRPSRPFGCAAAPRVHRALERQLGESSGGREEERRCGAMLELRLMRMRILWLAPILASTSWGVKWYEMIDGERSHELKWSE